jgi:DNA replication protein DnaC
MLQSVAISPGTGKSHLSIALGIRACLVGHRVAFATAAEWVDRLQTAHLDRTWATRLRRFARPALLILDDFAMRDFTVAQADDLYELVSERVNKSTIFTANRQASDWYGLFPNPVVSESILDRIVNSAHHLLMDGKSYRPNRRPGVSGKPRTTS